MASVLLLTAALWAGQASAPSPAGPAVELALAVPGPEEPVLERPSTATPAAPTSTPDRWLLMKALQGTWPGYLLDGSRTHVSGWVDLGATFGTASSNNLPLTFNYRDNSFSLQQNWVRIERTVLASGTTEPTFGFRSDWILPGTDYRFTVAQGLLSDQLTAKNGTPRTYGIDPVQFYAEAYFPTVGRGLDVKVGRFEAPFGVESITAPDNALFSHSYTFQYNPFTQTGALANLQLNREWSVQAGLVLGSDVFFDGGDLTFVGQVDWAPPGGRDSAILSVILGSGRFNQARQLNNVNLVDLVVTHRFSRVLTGTLETLAGWETNVPTIGTANWLGIVNYLTCDFTSRLSGTTRLEFWDDPQGQRTGFRGLYWALTAGVNFHPRKDLVFRPELRYDCNEQTRPFQGQHSLFTAAMDVVLRW
jgi:hypothetical protein